MKNLLSGDKQEMAARKYLHFELTGIVIPPPEYRNVFVLRKL